MVSFSPGILLSTGETCYPTRHEWVLAFAIRGIPWAIEQLEKWRIEEEQAALDEIHRTATD